MNNAPNSRSDSTLASLFRPLAVVFGLASAIVVVVFDIIIKQYITTLLLNARGPIEVTQFFNLVLGFNRGVSFGLLLGKRMGAMGVIRSCCFNRSVARIPPA